MCPSKVHILLLLQTRSRKPAFVSKRSEHQNLGTRSLQTPVPSLSLIYLQSQLIPEILKGRKPQSYIPIRTFNLKKWFNRTMITSNCNKAIRGGLGSVNDRFELGIHRSAIWKGQLLAPSIFPMIAKPNLLASRILGRSWSKCRSTCVFLTSCPIPPVPMCC